MTVVLTGGGSGGHITPLLAVAARLKQIKPDLEIIYIGQQGDRFADLAEANESIDAVMLVRAGKFRRFHGEGIRQILNIKIVLQNLRDLIYVLVGFVQSIIILRKIKPEVMFSRGGFVSVPVALAARVCHVPYITHDSDPVPSLTNRIIAPMAETHAVALTDKKLYPYPPDKTIVTGIPLNNNFVPVSEKLKQNYRQSLKLPQSARILFIIGGGLGSKAINDAAVKAAPELMSQFSNLYIFHVAGAVNEAEVAADYKAHLQLPEQGRLKVFGYINDVYKYSGAADVIITRAGATNLAEFALQRKACIVVPAAFLTGGHQLKNATYLSQEKAAVIVTEDQLSTLAKVVAELLNDRPAQQALAENLGKTAISDAADKIARLILEVGQAHGSKNS